MDWSEGKQDTEDAEEDVWKEQRALLLGNQAWSTKEGQGFQGTWM